MRTHPLGQGLAALQLQHSRTMNYVGQLAGQVFVQVKELYRGLNPATLSGCIDVIVVRQPDGSLQCSPFHVRFGKMGVLRSREKVIPVPRSQSPDPSPQIPVPQIPVPQIPVPQIPVPRSQSHRSQSHRSQSHRSQSLRSFEMVPSYLATSPIMTDGSALMESQMGKSVPHLIEPTPGNFIQSVGSSGENCTKKRRKRRKKSKLDSVKREDSEDSEDDDVFPIDMSSDEDTESAPSRAVSYEPYVDQMNIGPSSSSLMQNKAYTQCGEDWTRAQRYWRSVHLVPAAVIQSDSELLVSQMNKGKTENPEMLWAWGELPQAAKPTFKQSIPESLVVTPVSVPRSDSTHFRAITGDGLVETVEEEPLVPGAGEASVPASAPAPSVEVEAVGAAARADPESEPQSPGSHVHSKTDSPSKRKDKRSHHLGSDGVYLDDLTELEPEVAALYFPKSDGAGAGRGRSDMRSASQSPQSVGSSGMDSGVDSFSDQSGELPNIAISLCGGLTESQDITREEFEEKAVSYQEFADNPSIIDDPNLVVKIGAKYYNWSTAAPLVLAMQAFQKPLPKESADSGEQTLSNRLKDESSSSDDDSRPPSSSCSPETVPYSAGVCYKKTLRLSSAELASLQLKDGPNDVVFSVTTQYQGTCRCEGTIYLWNWDDKIVISDIDGTITRSDTLGHILPTLGKDWTHQGIARLYHKVSQ
ncbi:phosphatidate phosphatase LPIN1-like isoform X2 [Clarias magur]|uniref:phosphatidate phosphatase n=1 Tax=Clarias magur TaxID=1594786 RepID=A0A8J4T2P8_CLAMG|nr:phosphatidate phosphatase LPIN1-like isoform X2 [Clarias magur]